MQPIKRTCKIHNDKWEHVGKVYHVYECRTRENSTATTLVLEDDGGNIFETVVAYHQIEWLD